MSEIFDNGQEIDSIYIDIKANFAPLQKQLLQLSRQKTNTLVVNVDDSRLVDLNKHLDLKQRHLKETVRFYENNVIKPRTDLTNLDNLNKNLFQLQQIQNQKVTFEIDNTEIFREINNIRKELQAARFPVKIDKNNIVEQVETALKNTEGKLSVTIKNRESTGDTKNDFRELTFHIKQVEKAVKQANDKKGFIGNVVTGFQENIGANIQRQLSLGIRDTFGSGSAQQFRKAARETGKFVKNNFTENKEFIETTNEIQQILTVKLRQGAYKVGDGIIAALEDKGDTITDKINSFIKAATQDVDFSNVSKSLISELEVVSAKMKGAIFSETALRGITKPIGESLKQYRTIALQERALPLVRERAFEILNAKKGKADMLSTKAVTDETENLYIAVGGYAGARGLSGKTLVSGQMRSSPGLNELSKDNPKNAVIWAKNEDSDIPRESLNNAPEKLKALLTSISKPTLRGYSKDALEMSAQALAALEKNPEIKIKFVGESGGGFAAEEAHKIMELLGHGDKSDFIGVGTPKFIGGFDEKDRKIISPDEHLGAETNKMYGRLGLAERTKGQQILGVKGHPYENYRNANVAELQNFMFGSPGKVTPELITDFRKGAEYFKSQDKSQLNTKQIDQLATAAFQNLQHIKRYLLTSTDDFKSELEEIVQDFENIFVDLQPDDRELSEIKKAVEKAKVYLKHLQEQPGIEASLVANNIVKELDLVYKQVNSVSSKTTGITQTKYQNVLQEILETKAKLLDPKIGIVLPKENKNVSQEIVKPVQEIQKKIETFTNEQIKQSLENSKKIVDNFGKSYGTLKDQLKTKQFPEATLQAKTILENTSRAKADIESFRTEANIPKIGTTEASQVNQMLGQLSQLENNIKRQFAKAKIPLPQIDSSNVATQSKQVAKDITKGLEKGIQSSDVEQVFEEVLVQQPIEQVKKGYQIQSPSRVFIEIGKMVVAGFKKGLDSGKNVLSDFINDPVKSVTSLITSVSKLGLAYTVLTEVLPKLKDFLVTSVQVATEMENLNRKVVFASGDSATGKTNFERFSEQAKALKVDIRQSLEGAAGFLAATQNSSLEGAPSSQILENFNVMLATRSVDKQTQERFGIAVQQMASKGIQSEELRGQAGEAVPGFYNIFARSQGLTPGQLAKKLKNTPGGLSPETLIQASQQARAESIVGLPASLETSQAAINNFNNSLLELQNNTGKAFLPFQKLSLNATSTGLDLLSKNIDSILNFVKLLAIALTRPLWQPFITGVYQSIASLNLLTVKAKFSQVTLSGMFTAIKPMLNFGAELLVFQTVLTSIEKLTIAFSDMGGAASDFAKQSEKGLKDIESMLKKIETGKEVKKGNKEMLLDLGRDVLTNPLKYLNPFDTQNEKENKAFDDIQKGRKTGLKSGEKLIEITNSSEIQKQIDLVVETDKKLSEIQAKRRAIVQLNPENVQGLKELQKQEKDLLDTRFKNLQPVAGIQGAIEAQIRGLKAVKPLIKESYDQNKLSTDQYNRQNQEIDAQIAILEKRQQQITESVGKVASSFDVWKKNLTDVNILLQDTKTKSDFLISRDKTAFVSADIKGNVTPGNRQFINQSLDINNIQSQIKNLSESIKQSEELFRSGTESANVLEAYKVDANTGIARINQILSQVETDNEKFILQEFANLQQNKNELNTLQLQIAQSKLELVNQLREQTKQVAEYYQNIVKQTEQSKIEFEKSANDIKTLQQQNRIKTVLTNVGDNIFTQFADSLVANLQELNDIANNKIDKKSKILDAQFQLQDNLKQQIELQRSLPGNLPKIPVTLDFNGIDNNQNVQRLNDNLNETNDITGLINDGLDSFNSVIDENIYSSSELTKEFQNQNDNLDIANRFIKDTNIYIGESSELSKQFSSSLETVRENSNSLENVFSNISGIFGSIVDQTGKWIQGLTQGQGIVETLGNVANAFSNPLGAAISVGQSLFNGIQQSNSAIASPIAGRSIQDIINYKPSQGQSFYGIRDGGARQHNKVDLDSRVGGSQGAVVQALMSGTATARQITSTSGGVDINTVDPKGNKVTIVYNHLDLTELQKMFNGNLKQPIQVNAGQRLSTVTMDSLSTGAHLDFGVKINGKYVEPQQYLKSLQQATSANQNVNIQQPVNQPVNQPVSQVPITKYGHFAYRENSRENLVKVGNELLDKEAATAFRNMAADAAKQGVNLGVISGFRSVKDQETVFNSGMKARNQTPEQRAKVSAPAGFSQHHTGFAMDINSVEPSFGKSKEFRWLQQNAARYGFQMPFTPGNKQGVDFEPWHWNYTGSDRARQMLQPLTRQVAVNPGQTQSSNYLFGKASQYSASDFSGLTPTGRKALEALKNPNVRAFLDAVAVAEVGDVANTTGGYGYLFGDTNRESFNPNSLTSHPKKRVSAGGYTSSATGRYQTIDFVWDDDTKYGHQGLGLRDFKPQSQEVLAVGRLMYRGALEKVMQGDIQGAVTLANKEWASLQGNPYGQGTSGGKLSTFTNNFQKFKNPALQASLQGQYLNPGQLQNVVVQGSNLNVDMINQRSLLEQQRIDADTERKRLELLRKNEQSLRTFRRGLRDSGDQQQQNARQLQDVQNQYGNPIKSSTDSFNEQLLKQNREFDDNIRDRNRLIIELDDRIQTAKQLLNNPEITGTAKDEIAKGLNQSLAEKSKTQKELVELQKLKNESVQTAKNIFNTQEGFRQQSLTFEETQQEISKLQARLESLKALQQFNPLDEQVKNIPSLERIINLKQVDLETEKNIATVQERLFKKEITQEQANQLIELYKKQSVAKQEQIDLSYQEADRQQKLNELTREANNLQRDRQSINEQLQNQLTAINLLQRKNSSDYTLGNPLEINRDIQITENLNNYQSKRNEIFSNKELTDSQKKGQFLREALRNNERVQNIENTFEIDRQEQRIKDIQNSNERQRTLETFSNQPKIDLMNARASKINTDQGNPFVANKISRDAAVLQENLRYTQQLRELDAQIEQMKFNNIDTSELETVKDSLNEIHNLNLENVNNQFKTFGQTVSDVARNSVMSLSNSITDLIVKGGSLSDVFDNFFSSILSGFLNTGLNSLFGGIFGGLFYDGGIVKDKNETEIPNYSNGGVHKIQKAFNKEFSESGKKPMLAVVHQGELMIPADRVKELEKAGLTPDKLLGNFAFGGIAGNVNTTSVSESGNKTVHVQTTVINNQEYVTLDQFKQGLNDVHNQSVKKSILAVQNKMQTSNSYRRSVGI
ncbi:hypothetical protein NIES2100_05650 [Calothrix sp. NIES-2100]|uniref:D-alanyl-D-alanine carboxypeptidase family protein n=1 Tax=Calothrix sp. NIES-2100 TaxID=1954172 RepID=UPI000B5DD26F|nr:hypothetical protein NIES2100_05650 [Calothrix sp. NIES-2100]